MPGLALLKMSNCLDLPPTIAGFELGLERRNRGLLRRLRRSRSFRNRSAVVGSACDETNRACEDGKEGSTVSFSTCSTANSVNLWEHSIMQLSVESHDYGERTRCLIKMIGQQRQLLEQAPHRSPMLQLQARRFRSLLAMAQHLDRKSTGRGRGRGGGGGGGVTAELNVCEEIASEYECEQRAHQLGAEFSQMALSS